MTEFDPKIITLELPLETPKPPVENAVFRPDLTIDPVKWEASGFTPQTIKMIKNVGLVKNFLL